MVIWGASRMPSAYIKFGNIYQAIRQYFILVIRNVGKIEQATNNQSG